jgi:hypothetical protein
LDGAFFGSPITAADSTCFVVIISATLLFNISADYQPALSTDEEKMPAQLLHEQRITVQTKRMKAGGAAMGLLCLFASLRPVG